MWIAPLGKQKARALCSKKAIRHHFTQYDRKGSGSNYIVGRHHAMPKYETEPPQALLSVFDMDMSSPLTNYYVFQPRCFT